MSKFKHTPGPWKHSKGHIGGKIADFVSTNKEIYDGMHIHNGEKKFAVSSNESEANARLIAAAPEMLDLLIYIRENYALPHYVKTKYNELIENISVK